MNYLIDDLKLADFLMSIRPDYIPTRAVSEAQQFLGREGKAQVTPKPPTPDRSAMMEAMRVEGRRLDMCEHQWDPQFGHRHSICRHCGSIAYGD
jgi:hypothetical protein